MRIDHKAKQRVGKGCVRAIKVAAIQMDATPAPVDDNYSLAETINGQTITWLKEQAAQQDIHLAGSLLLLDEDNVYNSIS